MTLPNGDETKRIMETGETTESQNVKSQVIQTITDLDYIITNIDGANATQIKAAIKKLAQHQKIIIRRLVQL